MKKTLTITLTDLDNLYSVLQGLDKLFRTLILYYADKDDLNNLYKLVDGCSIYFETVEKLLDEGEDEK